MPIHVPVVECLLVELGVELHAPGALAGAEALARARRGGKQLDGPAGEREAVLVPVDARGARRERAEDRVAVGGRERPKLEPVEMAPRQPPHVATERVGEQLGAEAHAEHGHAALRGLAQQGRLRLQIGVDRGLLAAQRHDPVDRGELRERVAGAQEPLVEAQPRAAQRRAGMAEDRALEVVQDGDDRAVGHPTEASRTPWCGCPHSGPHAARSNGAPLRWKHPPRSPHTRRPHG